MDAIQEGSGEISGIVEIIESIAFQTNLLSVNAGVEAARAGEAGQGFAVVASEVRNLAARSSESANSIRDLIIRSENSVSAGADQMAKTVDALDAVRTAVVEITNQMDTIAETARSQHEGVSTINSAMSELDAMTQQNAAMFEETTAACTMLADSAQKLRDLTGRFQISSRSSNSQAA